MNTVLDASALLAFLAGEPGADVVEQALNAGAVCSAVNWSEVAQKTLAAGRDWTMARSLALSYDLIVEPLLADDAEHAARQWRRGNGLSLADRCCLALADRMDLVVLTADTAWGSNDRICQIR